jgi:sensor histidine kinase YesM
MKQTDELKKFRWLFFLLVPAFAISINLLLFGSEYYRNWNILLFSTVLLIAVSLLLSATQITLLNWMRRRFPNEEKLFIRILIFLLIAFPVTGIFVTGIFFGYNSIHFLDYQLNLEHYKWGLFTGFVCDLLGMAMNEGIYGYSKWKETKLQAEQLIKENLQTKLNSLLQQINPHFLFNSLNTISALMQEDIDAAQKYLSELSKVYRYLLRTNETELTTLAIELHFMDSYFHLLQTRFGKGVSLIKVVNTTELDTLFLPPLTLQLLVENAVKHNTTAKSKPLEITIICDKEFVLVENNLQKKTLNVEGAKIGLANIAEKYKLINKSSIEITETLDVFSVRIPLLTSSRV